MGSSKKAKWDFRALERRWNLSQASDLTQWGLERSGREERMNQVEGTVEPWSAGGKAHPVMSSVIQEVSWGVRGENIKGRM